jgi:hypothetical protein
LTLGPPQGHSASHAIRLGRARRFSQTQQERDIWRHVFLDLKKLFLVVGAATTTDLRKYCRKQVQNILDGAMMT